MRTPIRLVALVLFFLFSSALRAEELDTDKLLKAQRVDKRMTFILDNSGKVLAIIDDDNGTGTLVDGLTFTAPHEVELVYPNYNPFTTKIARTETTADDPAAKAVADFIKAVISVSNAVIPLPTPEEAENAATKSNERAMRLRGTEPCPDNPEAELLRCQKAGKTPKTCLEDYRDCRCSQFETNIAKAFKLVSDLKEPPINEANARKWISDANGKTNIGKSGERSKSNATP